MFRTPNKERKRKRRVISSGGNNATLDLSCQTGIAGSVNDPSGKVLKKINDYFSKHSLTSPVRPIQSGIVPGSNKSPLPFNATPGLYPQSPQAQFVSTSSADKPPLLSNEYTTLMQPSLKLPAVTKCIQTDLDAQFISELVSSLKHKILYMGQWCE